MSADSIQAVIKDFPFLIPFLILLIPVALLWLIFVWLLILARKGKMITINVKGLGMEIALATSLYSKGSDEGPSPNHELESSQTIKHEQN